MDRATQVRASIKTVARSGAIARRVSRRWGTPTEGTITETCLKRKRLPSAEEGGSGATRVANAEGERLSGERTVTKWQCGREGEWKPRMKTLGEQPEGEFGAGRKVLARKRPRTKAKNIRIGGSAQQNNEKFLTEPPPS